MDRKIEAFEAASRILEMVEDFGLNITRPISIINSVKKGAYPHNMFCNWGASRLVIWDDYCDYVIKIAIQHEYEKYNAHEAEIYWAAEDSGVNNHFAWCDCYIKPTINTPGIYVMEYVNCDEERVDDESWDYGYREYCMQNGYDSESNEYASEYNNSRCEDNEELIDFLTSDMDIKEREIFYTFFNNWNIHDIHVANVGFRGGKLVICDYAGWDW